jgi:hypothetical protein
MKRWRALPDPPSPPLKYEGNSTEKKSGSCELGTEETASTDKKYTACPRQEVAPLLSPVHDLALGLTPSLAGPGIRAAMH